MTHLLRSLTTRPFRALYQKPWSHSTAIASTLDPSLPVEEEKTPYYHPTLFYPAELGEILNGRYQLATKLGYGSRSTVWLAKDLDRWRWSDERYVAVKINRLKERTSTSVGENELDILRQISEQNSQHKGWNFVRQLLDSFSVQGVSGLHACLVFEPLREPLWIYRKRFLGNVIPSEVLKIMLQMILHGLDYLHSECHIIHADLKPDNLMVKIEDKSILARDARDEFEAPLPQKRSEDGRAIYLSRNNYGQPSATTGVVRITDFDLSVRGNGPHGGCIQAEVYRAPEVIIDAGFTYSADIWSLGVLLWDLLEGKSLFEAVGPHDTCEYDEQKHLAYITALLGPMPKDIVGCGKRSSLFYSLDGNFRDPGLIPKEFSFENTLTDIKGEDKTMFLNFVSRMVRWRPEERSTAKELLNDPWLYANFEE